MFDVAYRLDVTRGEMRRLAKPLVACDVFSASALASAAEEQAYTVSSRSTALTSTRNGNDETPRAMHSARGSPACRSTATASSTFALSARSSASSSDNSFGGSSRSIPLIFPASSGRSGAIFA
eukprot:CAMPEP_0119330898 /NCGR_PEP_ID=MMETSP1333-20130426/79272_1 /TAXON_ID=418940 /ORGANISM="Scyphosphaera apsteinii, Strain RCC1455" /LENGTH=122 /DNA_ID=CAMNT_0007340373 /DNA_START=66 /DNA_END=434 /DNA_ORIENTATION=+